MNLQEMELTHLVILWKASSGNPQIKNQIEAELKMRIQINTNFSREYFFEICKIKNHGIGVNFIPTSKSYELYGANLTIDIILSEEEMLEMMKNWSSKPSVNTSGIIKAKILVTDNLSQEQIANAANIGFHTSDIFETLHV